MLYNSHLEVKQMDKKKLMQVGAVILGSLLLGGAIGGVSSYGNGFNAGYDSFQPKVIETTFYVDKIVEVEKEVMVEVPTEVFVDNKNLGLVLDHIFDNDGNVEYLLEDLDDDELDQITDRIIFMNDIKKIGSDEVKNELADEIDKMEIELEDGSIFEFDEDDIERIRVNDDDDEIEVQDVDFEDSDAELVYTGRFEQDDVKFNFRAVATFKDGEFDELEDIEVTERD